MSLDNIEIALTKVNAEVDKLMLLVEKIKPGYPVTEPQVAAILFSAKILKELNGNSLLTLWRAFPKPVKELKWEGGDLAMDEGAILEVPAVKVVKKKAKTSSTAVSEPSQGQSFSEPELPLPE